MKTIKLIAVGMFVFISSTIEAQVSVSLNIGNRPVWCGPSPNYAAVDFYYLPDVQAYYDTRAAVFVYFGGNGWVRSRNLPHQYRGYDLNRCNKVALNGYRGYRPYDHFNNHRLINKYRNDNRIYADNYNVINYNERGGYYKHDNGHGYKHNGKY